MAVPLLAILPFLALSGHQLSLPGLHYDEAKEAGLNALQLLRHLPVEAFRGAGVRVGDVLLPFMVQEYIGALNVYLALPFLALGGPTVGALRLLSVLIGAATLLLLYRLALDMACGRSLAFAATLLLAVNPSYIFWSRQGIFVTNVTALLFVASLLAARRWWRTGRPSALYALALLWGLGLWAKLLFAWAVGAMLGWGLVAWATCRKRGMACPERRIGLRQGITAGAFLMVGLAPLLLFNLRTGGTVASVLKNLGTSYYGVRNAALADNLAERLRQAVTLLRGDHLWYLGGAAANLAAPWLAGGLVIMALVLMTWGWAKGLASRREKGEGEEKVGLPPLLSVLFLLGLMIVQSSFTVSGLFVTHYALLLPLFPLGAALAAEAIRRRGGRALGIVALVALVAWGWGDLRATLAYHRILARTGGHSAHADAVYALARYLDERGYSAPLALDWGFSAPIAYLTAGRVHPLEVFGYERLDAPDDAFAARLRPFLAHPAHVYLFHAPEDTVFRGRREALERMAQEMGLKIEEEQIITERSGRPLFIVARASRR